MFNGYGAQETTDVLAVYCKLYPTHPVIFVLQSEELYQRLRDGVFAHSKKLLTLIPDNNLPLLTVLPGGQGKGRVPFAFQHDAHKRYNALIDIARQEFYLADREWFDEAVSLGYLDPDSIILDDGTTESAFFKVIAVVSDFNDHCV